MSWLTFSLYATGLLTCLIGHVIAVSFYGESYVHIPYKDDFHDTDIELRFKASRPYGILLLLTGGADFLLLQLHAGTLQLKVNYGSEETLLDLGRHRYDDLEWHDVKVTRSDNIISMVIDGTTTVRQRINGKYRELNINKGIFIGGTDAETNKLFDHELKDFRGTFSLVLLNGMDLIAKARELDDVRHVVEVSFNNDDIFSASRDSPISFTSETSFASFSHVHPTYERTVSFQFWTDSASALLMFSFTRHSSKKNYFALELINDQLVLTGCKGDERVELISDSLISGKWHQLDVTITSELVELSVNGVVKSEKFNDKGGAIYGGMIYIGGVSHKERSIAINEGLRSLQGDSALKGSIIGCIKNIVINSRVYNIHDIHASRLISAECDIRDGCTYVGCSVDETPYADSNMDDFQLLAVNPVIVNEGRSAQITTDNIEIVYDFKQYGIRESGIMIYVVEKPKYGKIQVDLGRRRNSDVFTYLDLIGKKVEYIHNGSENDYDEVSMGLEIYSSSRASEEDFPERLQQRYKFILHITIKHVNDAPKIVLANNGVLRIIENTKILITSDVMSADDPDSAPRDLIYTVVEAPTQGYFEKSGRNGVPITDFTQQELNDHQIWFLHLGSGDAFVGLRLSDGIVSSKTVRLNIQTVRLRLMIQKKTGLVLPHGSYAIISSANLTTVSNVPTQELEIRYEILTPPRYGVLERQQYANGEWQEVSTFAQRHIDSGHVRYRQTDISQSPSSDQFRFKVKAKSFTTPYDYFRIQFEQVYIEINANNKLTLLHQPYGVLSSDNLRAVTNNPHLQDDKIIFTIIRPPSLGNFYKVNPRYRGRIDFFDATPLIKESSFSQYDINVGSIYYKLKSNSYEKVPDFSDIRVHTFGTSDKALRMWIEFVPMKSDVRFINNGLNEVIEGGQKAIDKHCLFIQTDDFRSFEFTITTSPRYGTLQLVDPRSSIVLSDNINEFTSEDIKDLKLVYKHDDSEHDSDSFAFTAVPDIQRTPVQNIPEFTGVFEIQMLMRNDNPPQRLVNEVFKVVRNGEKIITIDDLAFMDPDLDYDTDELMYERRGISNGQIIFAMNKTLAYNFKQKDIRNNEIMFQHSGDDHGEAPLYVTDGQYYVNCLLEIQAGEPYIKVKKNTGAIVRRRGEVVISVKNISIETNVNVNDERIRFVLIEEPEEGYLEVDGEKVHEFDLKSLKEGDIKYRHKGQADTEDYFIFAVVADEVRTQEKFSIQIVLESTQLPRVINNRPLEMFGSHRKNTILKEHLLITHPDSTAENIEYLILVMPKHGDLYRGETLLTPDGESTFTQLDINNELVKYELENTSAVTDQFIFEVSNGYEALRGLEFLIDIIPYTLVFETGNLSVIEGGKKVITSNLLKVNDKNSDYDSIQYIIHEKPMHGTISNYKGESLESFTSDDIDNGLFYIHDDGESKTDWFSLSASVDDGSKESEVKTVYIAIEGINDEAPVIVQNTGLKVWKGSLTQITTDNLYARDPDTPADELIYRISTPSNGHISHLNNTFKSISTFKQSWIDAGRIVFVHEGEATGEFSFEVNDGGNNKSPLSVFRVEARQLVLNLVTNNLLDAYPNTIQPITDSHLFTSTNDPNQTKPIIYSVTSMPRHGTLVTVVNGRPVQVTSFNQQAVNDSKIYYKHADKLNGWLQNDSFQFKVNTLYAEPSEGHDFKISISFANLNPENKDQLIRTSPIHVEEGGEMILAKNNLDVSEFVRNLVRRLKRVSLTFTLEDKPRHGTLTFGNKELKKNVRFTQRNVNAHEIMYKHDDSDTVFDTFNLTLHLRIEDLSLKDGLNNESLFRLVLNVTVQPVNDEKFELLTKNPSLQIVQGFTATINKSILNTVDNDTASEYIVYEIIREPDNGHVAYKDDVNKKILNFSQRDVNAGLVVFKHESYKDSGEFYFRVSDGSHSPFYRSFKVQVTKLFVNVSKNSTVELLQSDSVVHLTRNNLDIQTNGLRENVHFILSRQPRYGKLFVNNEIKATFTQKDVDENRILYKQSELEYGSDYIPITKIVYKFKESSYKEFFTLLPLHINIKVKPLLVSEPLFAPRGEHVALTVHSLDAVKLSERTGDNPRYNITSGPYFGKVFIYRKTISKRQVYHENYKEHSGYHPVSDFTHEDIVYTRVFYKSDIAPSANQDNFTYILTAFNAQPAEGVFYIDLEPMEDFPLVPDTESPDVGVITEKAVTQPNEKVHRGENSPMNDDSVEPSRLKYDHVLILAISIPLLIIIIIAFIVVYLVWRGRRKRDFTPSSKKSPRLRPHISGPFQIEQPHVHIEPQEKQSETSEDSKSLVEYENTHNIPDVSRAASEEADVVMPMLTHGSVHDQHFGPRSPDMSRTEVSCTVPTCKVTPLVDNDLEGAVGGVDEHRQSISSMGDMIEWITNDPELLQNCSSSSPPVLQKSRYWV